MKAIIWIIILAVIAWGIWYFMKDNDQYEVGNGNAAGQVEGASDQYNPSFDANVEAEVDSKG